MEEIKKEINSNIRSQADRIPFVVFFTLFTLLAWKMTKPLMLAMTWAALLSFMAHPIYLRILKRMRGKFPSAASVMTLVLLFLCIMLPLFVLIGSMIKELSGVSTLVSDFLSKIQFGELRDPSTLVPSWLPKWIADGLKSFLKDSEAVSTLLQNSAQWFGGFLKNISKGLFQWTSSLFFDVMIIVMVSFFFIRDGAKLIDYLKSSTPLSDDEKEFFFGRAKNVLSSVVFGMLVTVAIQAFLGGLGWWFVGLKNPTLFGMMMFFVGMFPAGTAVVWVPGGLYLLLTGDIKNGIILLVWGAAIVGTIDNLLRPILISGGDGGNVPTLMIIIGLFGGAIAWGFLGIFIGPLVLVLFSIVFDIFRSRWIKRRAGGDI
ncbi:MAG: AI-2E family transporter [Synergistaceae bacterium]|nr:AI-2E family transporter [Synergistaceae bacterium]